VQACRHNCSTSTCHSTSSSPTDRYRYRTVLIAAQNTCYSKAVPTLAKQPKGLIARTGLGRDVRGRGLQNHRAIKSRNLVFILMFRRWYIKPNAECWSTLPDTVRHCTAATVCHLLQHSVSAWTTVIISQQHEVSGLYNGDALCLLWGRSQIFKHNLRIMKNVYRFLWKPEDQDADNRMILKLSCKKKHE